LLVKRGKVARFTESTRELGRDIRDHERRLIRIEPPVEMAGRSAAAPQGPPRLPPP